MTHAGIRRFAALIWKESIQIVRDPSSILIAFVLPLILLFLFGYGVSLDANHLKIGLVIEDSSEPAQSLAASFRSSVIPTQGSMSISPFFAFATASAHFRPGAAANRMPRRPSSNAR